MAKQLTDATTVWQRLTIPRWYGKGERRIELASGTAVWRHTRAHLGVETPRQWSNRAIARTTPCLLGLFSLVTLLAARLSAAERRTVATSAWYRKSQPTFSDTLALVRRHLWREQGFAMSRRGHNVAKPQPALQNAIVYALCNAA